MNNFVQYDIWLVNLDPTVGAEIKKTRPCIILNNDDIGILPLKVIAPFTDFKQSFANNPWMVTVEPTPENGLRKKSVIDIYQLRSVSENRMVRKIGTLENEYKPGIQAALDSIFQEQTVEYNAFAAPLPLPPLCPE